MSLQLRRIHDDGRDHLTALREEVRDLQGELSKLMVDRESLEAENARLRAHVRASRRRIVLSLVGGASLAWAVGRLAPAPAPDLA